MLKIARAVALFAALAACLFDAGPADGLSGTLPTTPQTASGEGVTGALAGAAALEEAFTSVAEQVGPAVVSVEATYTVVQRFNPWGDEMFDDFFRKFFEVPPQFEQRQPVRSLGSGVIVSTDGYILTNAHVVGRAKTIMVRLLNKKEYKAKLIGRDEGTDLAVLKITPDGPVTAARLGDSDRIRVGQWAIAIGNPFALENTVTVGVISARGRQLDANTGGAAAKYTSFIQTDASINRGNSGGPLLNIKGEVIGINTMIFSTSGGSIGIGFAIPSNTARRIMEGIIKEGRFIRPQLGISYRPLAPEVAAKLGIPAGTGMEVTGVMKGSAAEVAGIRASDIILSVDGQPLKEQDDLRNVVLAHVVGDKVKIEVFRKGKRIPIVVTLREEQRAETETGGETEPAPRTRETQEAWMGMVVEGMTEALADQLNATSPTGVVVVRVEQESAAASSGIQRGDIIREMEQAPVKNLADFREASRKAAGHDGVLLLVERQGNTLYIVLKPKGDTGE